MSAEKSSGFFLTYLIYHLKSRVYCTTLYNINQNDHIDPSNHLAMYKTINSAIIWVFPIGDILQDFQKQVREPKSLQMTIYNVSNVLHTRHTASDRSYGFSLIFVIHGVSRMLVYISIHKNNQTDQLYQFIPLKMYRTVFRVILRAF